MSYFFLGEKYWRKKIESNKKTFCLGDHNITKKLQTIRSQSQFVVTAKSRKAIHLSLL